MLRYLPYAIQGVAAIGGIAGGLWLKSAIAPPAPEEAAEHGEANAAKSSDHSAKADESDPHAEKEAHKKADAKKEASKKDNDKKDAKKKKKDAKGGHGGGHGGASEAASAYGYLKFSRQFVVPVIGEAGVTSLVVLDINLEVPSSETETIYAQEPKLRDSLLATLLSLSNSGAFSTQLLEQQNLDAMRARLLESARAVIGENAQNVLILNITRQDV